MQKLPDPHQEALLAHRSISLAKWLAMSWVLMMVLGYATLRAPGALAAQNTVAADRSIFTTANTSTLTGFSQAFAIPADFALIPQIVFTLQVLAGLLLALIGGGVLMARLIGSKHSDSKIAVTGLGIIAFSGVCGATTITPGESLWVAIARGLGALAGAGTALSPTRPPQDLTLHALLLPLSILGGLGLVVLLDLWGWLVRRNPISLHAVKVITIVAGTYLIATLVVRVLLGTPTTGEHFGNNFTRASALVLAAQGFGATTEIVSQLPRGIDWILIGITLVGTGTLGTYGGMGLAWLGTMRSTEISRIAAWVGIQGAVMLLLLVALLRADPALVPERAVLLVASSVANIGLSHGAVATTGIGPILLAGLMIIGKLFPLIAISQLVAKRYPMVRDR